MNKTFYFLAIKIWNSLFIISPIALKFEKINRIQISIYKTPNRIINQAYQNIFASISILLPTQLYPLQIQSYLYEVIRRSKRWPINKYLICFHNKYRKVPNSFGGMRQGAVGSTNEN